VNEAHQHRGSDEWRETIRDVILPWALGDIDLGGDVLEVGPGYGATTDVLSQSVPRLTSVEIDDELSAMLMERFAEVPSVEIVHGDATSLAYAEDRFSGAACFTMLHHVATSELQDRLFAEVARVLRPGARWSPATAWPATSWKPTTRAIPTTRSTRRRCPLGWRRPASTTSRCAPIRSAGRPSRGRRQSSWVRS
jgi:ubiquinone/menaquinone biosynthesis C-methylase UbiE